jgi:hypothetical protein
LKEGSLFLKNRKKPYLQMRENPAISDWVRISKGLTEGLLGGGLAQRQAALRGVMAAGARFNFSLVSRACRLPLEHLLCHENFFWN